MSKSNGPDRPQKDVALFLDFENVYISVRQVYSKNPDFEAIVEKAEEYGRLIISRAYADWYHYQRMTNALYANGIEPVYVPTYYYGQDPQQTTAIKNSVDIHLVIDAMRMLYTHDNIETFIFVTGDRDFIPLMNAIRQYGKECIVIGVAESASSHLAQSADEFHFYHQLSDDVSPEEHTKDPYEALVQAIHLARKRNSEPTFATIKLLMQEIMGSFDQSNYQNKKGKSFSKFKEFVKEAEQRGKVTIFSNGTLNMVLLPGEKAEEVSQFIAELVEEKASFNQEQNETERQKGQSGKDKGQNGKDKGQSSKDKGQSSKGKGQSSKDKGQSSKDKGQSSKDKGQSSKRKINGPNDLILEAIHLARQRNNLCTMATLKVLMKEIQPKFDEANYKNASGQPYSSFKRMVLDFVAKGQVQVLTTGTVDEVFLPEEDPRKLSRFANRRRR
jgi:uncharacterized protein (TIGR00288 family)